jgi:hypothetical protein
MGCLGVHFAITAEQAAKLLAAEDDEELVEIVGEEIEEAWEMVFETDKAWDALHRCLSNGTLNCDEGEPPLNRVFFGGRVLNSEADYFVVLLEPPQVQELAEALAKVNEEWLRERYFGLSFPNYQVEKSDEDCDYVLANFAGLPAFFAQAAAAGRYVIFTVDQ